MAAEHGTPARWSKAQEGAGGMLLAPGALHWKDNWKQLKKDVSHSHLNWRSDPSPSAAAWKRGGREVTPPGLRAGKELGSTAVFCAPRALEVQLALEK